ncbi:MAG: serine hydrolase [Gemmatimonadetes bacterium]|nr:class A beta-lactamase-related serine hydrolase [Gemmatimonadota bacterium]NNF11603.1 serine hydrolase [Gemmatimonadota bacterium]
MTHALGNALKLFVAFGPAFVVCACASEPGGADVRTQSRDALRTALDSVVQTSGAEVVGIYYRSLAEGGDSITIDADVRMHAASTMKVPVMQRLFLDHQEGLRSLDSTLPVKRTFRSIVDGSTYDLPPESDSDTTFYGEVGGQATIREMVDRMITWSSNLATNILIEAAEPERIETMLAEIGADSMSVLRGVEDLKAFEAGLSNSTTARGLGAAMAGIVESEVFSEEVREGMLDILSRQHFTGGIPSGVPDGVRVANKTGWITGIHHDAAIVLPEDASTYVLVILVRGHPAEDQGEAMIADLSALVWAHQMGN